MLISRNTSHRKLPYKHEGRHTYVSLKLLNKSDKSDEGTAKFIKFIKLQISNENEVREKFSTCSLTYRCSMFINRVFSLSFARKRHRKNLNDQYHSQMSNLDSKVGNLFGSFSA